MSKIMKNLIMIFILFSLLFFHKVPLMASASADNLVKKLLGDIGEKLERCQETLKEKDIKTTVENLCQTVPINLIQNFSEIAKQYETMGTVKKGELVISSAETAAKNAAAYAELKKAQEDSKTAIMRAIAPNFEKFCESVKVILNGMLSAIPGKRTLEGFELSPNTHNITGDSLPHIKSEQYGSYKDQYGIYLETILDIMRNIQTKHQAKITGTDETIRLLAKIVKELTTKKTDLANLDFAKEGNTVKTQAHIFMSLEPGPSLLRQATTEREARANAIIGADKTFKYLKNLTRPYISKEAATTSASSAGGPSKEPKA